MIHFTVKCVGLYLIIQIWSQAIFINTESSKKNPTVFISIAVRNKAHILPYFLATLYQIDYPKNRISLWIRCDHNEDDSIEILDQWLRYVTPEYHNVKFIADKEEIRYAFEDGVAHWTEERFNYMINLREEAIITARRVWADYIWFLDSDVFVTEPRILKELIKKNEVIVSPMLLSEGMYSNYWCGMTTSYYYKRTEDYEPILNHKILGCHVVPMVHSSVLIDLTNSESDKLTFLPSNIPNYDGPVDDIISFAISAKTSGILMHICNDKLYGYIMTPLESNGTLEEDKLQFTNLKLFILNHGPPLPVDDTLSTYLHLPQKHTLGLDQIYVINLPKRTERKQRMSNCLDELGLQVNFINGIDGQTLSDNQIKELGIIPLPGYTDPYHKRPIKKGEIGCFLSHYRVWTDALKNNYNEVLILEDDLQFENYFIQKMSNLINQLHLSQINWDLVYIGRKIVHESMELPVNDTQNLVYPDYSYWTVGYLLSQGGIQKLIDAKPFSKLVPVDEFLPIMYDKHPRKDWKSFYPNRNLIALSVNPLLVYPVRYLREEGYVSDTEDSSIFNYTTENVVHEEF